MPGGQVSANGGRFDPNVDPGNVNAPAVFEPSADLAGTGKIWAILSGGPNWGGAVCSLSFDGTNYTTIGTVTAAALQGVLTATLASHADPDTTDTLAIDLTQSAGIMPTAATHADADAFRALAAVIPAVTIANNISNTPELIAYGSVAATGTYTSNLTYLRRGLFGTAPAPHPTGSIFIRLQRAQAGAFASSILAMDLDPQYIGQSLTLKFRSFNVFGRALQDISTVTPYQYIPSGASFTSGFTLIPGGWKIWGDTDGRLKVTPSAGGTVSKIGQP